MNRKYQAVALAIVSVFIFTGVFGFMINLQPAYSSQTREVRPYAQHAFITEPVRANAAPTYVYGTSTSGIYQSTWVSDNAYHVSTSSSDSGSGSPTAYPTSGTDDSSVGTKVWTNPNNICVDDGVSASCPTDSGTSYSHYLKGLTFVFSTLGTINGIQLKIEHQAFFSYLIGDFKVSLVKAGTPTGNNYANMNYWTYNAWEIRTYGGSTDLWGTSWTADQINAVDFGAVLQIYTNGASLAYVDYFRIQVWYSYISYRIDFNYPFQDTNVTKAQITSLDWTAEGKVSAGTVGIFIYNYATSLWVDTGQTWGTGEATKTGSVSADYADASCNMKIRFYATGAAASFTVSVDFLKWDVTVDPPEAVILASPSNCSVLDTLKPTFLWQGVVSGINPCSYRIVISNVSNFATTIYNLTTPQGRSWLQINDSMQIGLYYWKVRAIDQMGNVGAWSQTWEFYTGDSSLILISPENGAYTSSSSVNFTWGSGENNYILNPSFETGNTTNWQSTRCVINDTMPFKGKYCLYVPQNGVSMQIPRTYITNKTFLEFAMYRPSSATNATGIVLRMYVSGAYKFFVYYMDDDTYSDSSAYKFFKIPMVTDQWVYVIMNITQNALDKALPISDLRLVSLWIGVYYLVPIDQSGAYFDMIFFGKVSNYQLEIASDNEFTQNIQTFFETNTYRYVTDLTSGTYYWRVKEQNSNQWSITRKITIDLDPPNVPNLFYPLDNQALCDDTLLVWNSTTDAGAGIDHYRLQLSQDNFATIDYDVTTNRTWYQFNCGVLAFVEWYWRVCAVDKLGNQGGWSTIRHFYQTADPQVNVVLRDKNNAAVNEYINLAAFNITYHRSIQDGAGIWYSLSPYMPVINMYSSEAVNITVRDWMGNYILNNQRYSYAPTILVDLDVWDVCIGNGADAMAYVILRSGNVFLHRFTYRSDLHWLVIAGNYNLTVIYPAVGNAQVYYNLTISGDFGIKISSNMIADLYSAADNWESLTGNVANIVTKIKGVETEIYSWDTTQVQMKEAIQDASYQLGRKIGDVEETQNILNWIIVMFAIAVVISLVAIWGRAGTKQTQEDLDHFRGVTNATDRQVEVILAEIKKKEQGG